MAAAKEPITSYKDGFRDGIPIALGYFAVSFTFGMAAVSGGLRILDAVLISATNVTSAGQFAALDIIFADGAYLEIFLTQLIINLRYMLMSFSVAEKLRPDTGTLPRLLMAFGMTDEIFGIDILHASRQTGGEVRPWYHFGAMSAALPGWILGTLFGAISGGLLPAAVISALGIAIYGMFLAIILPPAKQNPTLLLVVIFGMLCSAGFYYLPYLKRISSGFVIILVTVAVAAAAAVLRPVEDEEAAPESKEANAPESKETTAPEEEKTAAPGDTGENSGKGGAA